MGTKTKNAARFDLGISMAKKIIDTKILEYITSSAMDMLVDAEIQKEYHNLTGNTLTSYSVGIYKDSSLLRIINISEVDDLKSPTSKKLGRKNGICTIEDYDTGSVVGVRANSFLDTDGDYGYNTASNFLKSYSPPVKGWTAVMCTGTEYSDFLEITKGLNVLSETAMLSPRIVLQNLKPIK